MMISVTQIQIVATCFSLSGSYYFAFINTVPHRGWAFFLVASSLWLLVAYLTHMEVLMFQQFIFLFFETYGFIRNYRIQLKSKKLRTKPIGEENE